jgi:hypothetical protein
MDGKNGEEGRMEGRTVNTVRKEGKDGTNSKEGR